MESFDKMIKVIICTLFVCFLIAFISEQIKDGMAISNGYSEVQLQSSTSTMWVKGECK